ncbi:MAG: Gfo/Idh/MocA family oxidoreductase [Pseudomonas sp.]|uniref:Gfo/Idh/MocA family protein n=1 Tax=Pseudomonas sp. TaxID=306 RepID=UPI001E0F961F|nr:Gfo/Idh/MocA family oxidoreductase [Pseudomonas sp.]MPS99828.1 Gfo/Idh/MocA family oxidoreductase [Pseudomonas sp.]
MNADRPLRLGVAGLGRAFTLMLPTLQRDTRVRLVAACDPREAARERFASDFDAPVYPDIEGLASNPDVEAIYIASPHQFHAEQARIAARHGKHVLVEKPMALSLGDCNAMIRDCRDARVHLIVGHCHSFDTPYLRAREIALGGELGRVRMIHALNYTDFLYRPRRPEELRTEEGGGVVFSQAAHQVDIVRLLAGARVSRVRAITGDWDPRRPTQGAYSALLWFEGGAFASVSYNGYGHFDSDEWCDWIGEMGSEKSPEAYGAARRKLATVGSPEEEARLKAAGTYGGPGYLPAPADAPPAWHQHFGPVLVSCERGDIRPLPDSVCVYGDLTKERRPLGRPAVPRFEVIDELYDAVVNGTAPLHDGEWARSTLEVCLALLESAGSGKDVELLR